MNGDALTPRLGEVAYSRRRFLTGAGVVAGAVVAGHVVDVWGRPLAAGATTGRASRSAAKGRTVVFVELAGGNDAIDTVWVPGAWEIPIAAKALAATGRYDAIIALGAVMRGATYHFEIVANHSAAGLARIALDTGVVITNGIITVDTMDQALERAGSKAGNKGIDAGLAALETVDLLHRIKQSST